jgi:hypothetical protein
VVETYVTVDALAYVAQPGNKEDRFIRTVTVCCQRRSYVNLLLMRAQ